jgi:hypothetical protein
MGLIVGRVPEFVTIHRGTDAFLHLKAQLSQ